MTKRRARRNEANGANTERRSIRDEDVWLDGVQDIESLVKDAGAWDAASHQEV